MINNYIMESETDLLYDPARYTGIDQVVVDNDNDTIGLSGSFISTVNNKLDASTFTAYTAAHAGDDVTPYTAGANINITNHVVSGKDWSSDISNAVSGKLDTSTYNTFVASTNSWDKTPYTAGANINITNHVVSGKDWSSEIGAKLDTSTYNAYTAAHAGDDVTPYTNGTGISISNHQISCTGDITPYSAGSNINITNHVVSGKDWSSTIDGATSGKLNTSTFNTYTAAHTADDVTPYTAGTDIKISNHVIGIDTNGTVNGNYNFIAGYNTYIRGNYNLVAGYNCSAYYQNQNSNYNAVFGNNNLVQGYETLVAGVGCSAKATRSTVIGDSNSANGRNIYIFGVNNTMTSDVTENSVSVCIGHSNTMNTCSGTFLFGNELSGDNGSHNRIKMGFGKNYLEVNGDGSFYKVVNGTAKEIQNKLTDITDVQVVNALPASPVANVLYLVKE